MATLPFYNVPNLLYIGDVPVESSHAGAALLFRILQNYPKERLRICEGNLSTSLPKRRLPDVKYCSLEIGKRRWLNTRFNKLVSSWFALAANHRLRQVHRQIKDFKPEAVLTVSHDYSWITAAAFAERNGLPLHLICHDDWPRRTAFMAPLRSHFENEFGRIYRMAKSRFCVSPFMAEEYERRYGVGGTVLYPSRDLNTPVLEAVVAGAENNRPFTLGYAGSIVAGSNLKQLAILAKLAADMGARLLLFGPFDEKPLKAVGINLSNVVVGGMVSSATLVGKLHQEVDVMVLPMSFEAADIEEAAINFPSKLTDYTAAGLPLLIWGPESNSAVKWAKNEAGVAAVLSTQSDTEMGTLLKKLKDDYRWRSDLAAAAKVVGQRYFSPETARSVFCGNLMRMMDVSPK